MYKYCENINYNYNKGGIYLEDRFSIQFTIDMIINKYINRINNGRRS